MPEQLLGIDVGTTGVRALRIDRSGAVVATGSAEYPLDTPRPLWAEQDPERWWGAAQQAIGQAGGEVEAIGLTGQMHGSVFLDADGRVIRPAILWCDGRTEAECREIEERVPNLAQITCNAAMTGFTAPKILWVRKNEPENFSRIRKVLLPKDFLRYRLTGTFATEVSDASGTSLFDVPNRQWSGEILDALELPREWMPDCHESTVISAKTSDGIPVASGAGDCAAGAVGVGITREGLVSTSLGTSGVVFSALDVPRVDPTLSAHTFCHAVPRKWHVMGVMLSAGGALRWYRDIFCSGETYDDICTRAATAPPGCDGLTFLPYLAGERTPHKNPYARAAFVGATLAHGRAHFDRAVLEGVAFGLMDSYGLIQEMGVAMHEVRALGGGARSDVWLQILAEVTGLPHVRVAADEGPAYGAALLAGVGIGWWNSVEEACDATIQLRPGADPQGVPEYRDAYGRFRSLYRLLEPAYH